LDVNKWTKGQGVAAMMDGFGDIKIDD